MFESVFAYSILKRAQNSNLITIRLINLRDFATDRYKTVDDRPYGGGVGMILKVDVVDKAIESAKKTGTKMQTLSILLDPKGKQFTQKYARELAKIEHLILVCGHYEGVDERVNKLVDLRLSSGAYILTGGELPAMTVVDSVTRLVPQVLPQEALLSETFTDERLEFPQYTRPANYNGMKVPFLLMSGNHAKILKWRSLRSKKIKPLLAK